MKHALQLSACLCFDKVLNTIIKPKPPDPELQQRPQSAAFGMINLRSTAGGQAFELCKHYVCKANYPVANRIKPLLFV